MNFQRLTAACHIPRSQCWSSTLPGPSLPVTRFPLCHGGLAGGSGRLLLQRGRVWPGNPWEFVEFVRGLGKSEMFLTVFFFLHFLKHVFPEMFHFFEIDVAVRGSY